MRRLLPLLIVALLLTATVVAAQPQRDDRGKDAPEKQDAEKKDAAKNDRRKDDEHRVEIKDHGSGFQSRGKKGHVDVDVRSARASIAPNATGGSPLSAQAIEIIEYRDENANLAFDLTEPVLQRHRLADLAVTTTLDDTTRTVRYALPGQGALALIFHLDPARPDAAAKYDVLVESFTFLASDTRLALGNVIEAAGGVRALKVDGLPAVAARAGEHVGYLSWVTHADVDGTDTPVGWSVHISQSETDDTAIVYWSYAQGTTILHDPTLGILTIARTVLGSAPEFALGLIAMGALVGGGYAFRRRARA